LSRAGDAPGRRLAALPAAPVLDGLDRKLSAFEAALGAFTWPQDPPPWFQARLVTAPSEAAGKLAGTARTDALASPLVKIASSGFNAGDAADLDAGAYSFDLSLGPSTETLDVDVAQGDTWGDVLGKVQAAVNQGGLAARADVVYQVVPFQQGSSLPGTGSMLALSVNPDRPDQDLRLSDRSGGLLSRLRLSPTERAAGPAQEASYSVTGLQTAQPTFFSSTPQDPRAATTLATGRHDLGIATGNAPQASTYISSVYNPDEAATLSAGTYTFTSTYAGEARAHTVTIGAGWTWGDVLRVVGGELRGEPVWRNVASPTLAAPSTTYSQPGVTASVDPWPIPSAATPGATTDGQSLTVTGAPGKDFSLDDVSGGLLAALGLDAKLTGTPVSFNVNPGDTWNDVYRSAGVAIGSAQRSLRADTVETAIPSTVTPGRDLRHQGAALALTQVDQRIGERVVLSDGGSGVLASLGVSARESPGRDGRILVDGREMVSENNTFSLDQGRVLLGLESTFGDTLPVSVVSGMEETEKGWGRVTDAWNALARYLRNNQDVLSPALGAALEAPLAAQKGNLRWLGVSSAGRSGQLWTNADVFWGSLYADTQRARSTLWDAPGGVVPAWRAAASGVRAAGLESWLAPRASFEDHRPALTSEFQLEQKHRLVKLLG